MSSTHTYLTYSRLNNQVSGKSFRTSTADLVDVAPSLSLGALSSDPASSNNLSSSANAKASALPTLHNKKLKLSVNVSVSCWSINALELYYVLLATVQVQTREHCLQIFINSEQTQKFSTNTLQIHLSELSTTIPILISYKLEMQYKYNNLMNQ